MTIPAQEPHIIPASEAKVFESLWIRNFIVQSNGVDEESSIFIEVCPYNAATGEIDHSHPTKFTVPLWATVNTPLDGGPNPAAVAMGAVFQAIPWLQEYHASRNEAAG